MRDRNQGRQNQQEQSNERNSQNLVYEKTSGAQQQRGREQTPERGRSGIDEPTKRSGSEKERLSESESV